jgi:Na+/H+ antiporter NhaD/arsenite permease-like protein
MYLCIHVIIAWVSTVAGNFTLTGSAANIIVCEKAQRHKLYPVSIGAVEHFRYCGLITLLVISIGIVIIYFESNLMGFIKV